MRGVGLVVAALAGAALGVGCARPEPQRPPTPAEVLERTCGMGDGEACSLLGDAFARGKGRPRERSGASMHYMRACHFKNARSCRVMAELFLKNLETPHDPTQPGVLLKQACDGGDATGCRMLAQAALDHAPGAPAEEQAVTLLERSVSLHRADCSHGIIESCDELGRMYSVGQGVAQDAARGDKMQRVACEGGFADACLRLGDREHAIAALREHCDGDDARACSDLAAVLRDPAAAADTDQALALSRKACERAIPEDCERVGEALAATDPPRADAALAQALQIWDKECAQGYGSSCLAQAQLLESGKVRDPGARARASAIYRSLCSQGHTWSCAHLQAPASAPAAPTRPAE